MRKKDERRKQRRDAYKERKKLEKQARKDEIKELRALKKKEIEEKLKKLKKLAGDDDLPLNMNDLEADFDPTAYDKRMEVCSLYSCFSNCFDFHCIASCSHYFFIFALFCLSPQFEHFVEMTLEEDYSLLLLYYADILDYFGGKSHIYIF